MVIVGRREAGRRHLCPLCAHRALTTVEGVTEEGDRGCRVLWKHLAAEGVEGKVFSAGRIEAVKALRPEKGGGTPRGPGGAAREDWPILCIQ